MAQFAERVEEMQQRFRKMVEDIDRSLFRGMEGAMYRCAANCCDNKSYSIEMNEKCIMNCISPVQNAKEFLQSEISRFQNRLSRCFMECGDKMKDKMGEEKSSLDRHKEEADECTRKCIDTHFELMHTIRRSVENAVASGKFEAHQISGY